MCVCVQLPTVLSLHSVYEKDKEDEKACGMVSIKCRT